MSVLSRLIKRKTGWIGVDVGTSTVKVAQVAHNKQGWNLTASAVIPRQGTWQLDQAAIAEAISSLDELRAARSLQTGYRGRCVAATLPMVVCDVHRLDRALDQQSNRLKLLRQTIETATQRSAEHVQCDYWSSAGNEDKPDWSQVLTVERSWTDQLCEDIAKAGWSCEKIDGLPLTMARAVSMVQPENPALPMAALDWGYGRATLCLIENGQPTYVRCLKDCSHQTTLATLVEELQVSEVEAQKLLEEYGLSTLAANDSNEIAHLVQEIIAEPVSRLVEEIKRSCSHFQYLCRAKGPQHLYLFGGGATIKHLDTYLAGQLNIKSRIWQLSANSHQQATATQSADCLLAPAIALSAMAWEAK